MSIVTPPPANPATPRSSANRPPKEKSPSASDSLIDARIAEAASALWWAELTRLSLKLVIAVIAGILAWVVIDQWIYSPGMPLRWAALSLGLVGIIGFVYRRIYPIIGSAVLPEYAARSLEHDLPELRQSLTSYVTLRGESETSGLQGRVVRSIGLSTANRLKTHNALPVEATGTMAWWIATAGALSLLVAYAVLSPKNTFQSAVRLVAPMAAINSPRRVSIVDVLPGDVDAIAGRSVDVAASIDGMRSDEEAVCQWDLPSGSQQAALQKDVDAGPRRYSGSFVLPHSASGVVSYRIIAGDATAGPFRLNVRDIPVVAMQSVLHRPPTYTGRPEYTSSSGSIAAIDGTEIVVRGSVNRKVSRAVVEFNPRPLGDVVRATAGAKEVTIGDDGTSLSVAFRLKGTRGRSSAVELDSYRIQVWDESGQSNPDPIIYPIRVIADLPPEVAIVMPINSPKNVPINAQQVIEVHASDPDFGLQEIRLEIRSGIDLIDEPVLWSAGKSRVDATGNQVTEYRFRPGEQGRAGLGMRIGDTVHVIAVAVDNRVFENDPTVEPNLTRTDPIQLKIVAADELPPAGDPESEGMSEPDNRPATDTDKKEGSGGDQSGEGQPQQGGGGSGGEGASKQQPGQGNSGGGEAGKGQKEGEGNNEGEGQSGEGQSGDGESGGERQPGEKSSGGSSAGENSGEGSNDPSQGGQSQGEPSQGEPSSSDASSGDPSMSPDQAGSDPGTDPSGQPGSNQSANENASPQGSGQSQGSQQSQGGDQNGSTSQSKSGQSESSPSKSGASETGQSESGESESGQGEKGPNEAGGESEPSSPQHDGEAFERIKEFLDQKSQDQTNQGQSAGEKNGGQQAQSGESGNSESKTGDGTGEQKSGEKGSSGSSSSEQGSAPEKSASQSDGQSGQPDQGNPTSQGKPSGNGANPDLQGKSEPSENGKPDGQEGQSGDSASSSDASKSGSKAGSESTAEPSAGEKGAGETGASENGTGEEGKSEAGTGEKGNGQSKPSQPSENQKPADGQDSSKGKPSDGGKPGIGNGTDGAGKGGDVALPPDPVNQEYTKQATDMVLDYLEQTRDQPDSELLEKLNWTADDLKRFRDRWSDVRDIDPAQAEPGKPSRDIEDALRSLGMRQPAAEKADNQRDAADTLRGIRDSGNRKPPPAAYRDAFDAFRRAMGRSAP